MKIWTVFRDEKIWKVIIRRNTEKDRLIYKKYLKKEYPNNKWEIKLCEIKVIE